MQKTIEKQERNMRQLASDNDELLSEDASLNYVKDTLGDQVAQLEVDLDKFRKKVYERQGTKQTYIDQYFGFEGKKVVKNVFLDASLKSIS